MWPLPPCCCGCEKAAAAAEEQPYKTLQRPSAGPPPALAGSLVGWRRRPCRGGLRHVLPPGKKPPAVATGGEEELEEGPPSALGRPLSYSEKAVARRGLGMVFGAFKKEGAALEAAVVAARGRCREWESSGRARP